MRRKKDSITLDESTFYSLAVFALRYSMGGGTIQRECIIGDVISTARLKPVAERLANCLTMDWESYTKDVERKLYSKPSENWERCIAWFRAIQEHSFYRLYISNLKNNKVVLECVAFKWNKRWISAKHFLDNQTAIAYIPEEYIVKEEPIKELPDEKDLQKEVALRPWLLLTWSIAP